jgi:O-antigen biosynthesis protein
VELPLYSVFTPTHRPDHLEAAFASLLAQTERNWEWIIVPNGPCAFVTDRIRRDPRVRVLAAPDELATRGIGALKRFACGAARGRVLVELDHDDLLMPRALARIGDAIGARDAGFAYSDFANFRADGTSQVYDAAYGWESYPVAGLAGEPLVAMRAFDAGAAALHAIYYAPNHVRAWHRDTYARAGGHDGAFGVADDYDLVCRTWLTGAPFVHIGECLYLYRLWPDGANTFVARNAEIQQRQQEVANRYVYALIAEECRRRALPMADLGGDAVAGHAQLDLCDLASGRLCCADDALGCVRAYDCLDRLPSCAGGPCAHERGCLVGAMNEIHRVLVPGGWLVARVAARAEWNSGCFAPFTDRLHAGCVAGAHARFQATRVWREAPVGIAAGDGEAYIHADLVALKGQRQPGIVSI